MTPLDLLDEPEFSTHGVLPGVTIGKVTSVEDPEKLGRVRVRIARLSDQAETHWARVLRPAAGAAHGLHLPIEKDDEVLVAFADGQPEFPIVLGALRSSKVPPLVEEAKRQDHRTLTSRSGHTIRLDDTADAEKIEILDKTGKNSLTFDTANNTVTIASADKIVLQAAKALHIASADAELTIDCKVLTLTATDGATIAAGAIALESDDTVSINGPSGVTINDGALEVK